jgi:hypothetical protein
VLFKMVKLSLFASVLFTASSCSNVDSIPLTVAKGQSGLLIKGISVVAPVNVFNQTALQPIADINANSIAIMPYAFCSIENPEVKYNQHGQHWGENIDGVIGSIQLAHQNKMSVMLKPHLWIGHGIYTGEFSLPTENDWQLWENSYRTYLLNFATVADSLKAELFCIGTELGKSIKERPAFWNSLIDTLQQVFHGKLTYAGNWDDYKNFPFWEKLDYIGVDAYFPLDADETPEIIALKKGWRKYSDELEKISMEHNRPILFTEYGYRNVDNTGAEPWKENAGSQNDKGQANAFEALYQNFVGKKWFMGGYVWKWYTENSYHRKNIDFTPQGKPAEQVIKNWYK